MASTDSIEDVTAFAALHEADFAILSDENKSAARAFGVLSVAGYAKRWTYYVDSNGVIVHIDKAVSPGSAGPDLAAHLAEFNFPRKPPLEANQAALSENLPGVLNKPLNKAMTE